MAGRDAVDEHVRQWRDELPALDPLTEGIVTRMQRLVLLLAKQSRGLLHEDRRRVQVRLTSAGAEVWSTAVERQGAAERNLISVLSDVECRGLDRTLRRLLVAIGDAGDVSH